MEAVSPLLLTLNKNINDIIELEIGIDSEKGGEALIIYKIEGFDLLPIQHSDKEDIKKRCQYNLIKVNLK